MSIYLLTAYIRHSYATDRLGLPPQHPLYRKHACLVIRDLKNKTAAAHGFGFNGYLCEPMPKRSKILYKQSFSVSKNEQRIANLYNGLTSRYTPNYCIKRYNCVDHLLICLHEQGFHSHLLNYFKRKNRRWYQQRGH